MTDTGAKPSWWKERLSKKPGQLGLSLDVPSSSSSNPFAYSSPNASPNPFSSSSPNPFSSTTSPNPFSSTTSPNPFSSTTSPNPFASTPKCAASPLSSQKSVSDEVSLNQLRVQDDLTNWQIVKPRSDDPAAAPANLVISEDDLAGASAKRSSKRCKTLEPEPLVSQAKVEALLPHLRLNPSAYGREINRNCILFDCGVAASQGPRRHMEDRYAVVGALGCNIRTTYYGVFDGHGGASAADFCAKHMDLNFIESEGFPSVESLHHAFLKTNQQFLETPRQVAGRDKLAGSTAVTVVIRDKQIWVANVGDSRAVLVKEGGHTQQLTVDHKPTRPQERKRIEEAQGTVEDTRVNGILSMSRAIGDKMLKKFVIAEPDSHVGTVEPGDQYLILGTDGLWDFISNDDASKIVQWCSTAQQMAEHLVAAATCGQSNDNITVMVIDLRKDLGPESSMLDEAKKPDVAPESGRNEHTQHHEEENTPTLTLDGKKKKKLRKLKLSIDVE